MIKHVALSNKRLTEDLQTIFVSIDEAKEEILLQCNEQFGEGNYTVIEWNHGTQDPLDLEYLVGAKIEVKDK